MAIRPTPSKRPGFDGAGAMVRRSKDVAASTTALYPRVVYTHCAAHRLNLYVVKCFSVREDSNMMQTADSAARLFKNSPRR